LDRFFRYSNYFYYSFDASKSSYSGSQILDGNSIDSIGSENARQLIVNASNKWSNVANISFHENNVSPELVFGLVSNLDVILSARGAFLPYSINNSYDLDKADMVFLKEKRALRYSCMRLVIHWVYRILRMEYIKRH